MKTYLTLLGLAILGIHGAFAVITVPTDFPMARVNGNTATDKDQVALLVSRYQNDVVLLVNPADAYSKEILNTAPSAATAEKLRALGSTAGNISVDSLSSAVTALVRQNPADAPTIVASAIDMLRGLPGGKSPENREKIARAAIQGLPDDVKDESRLIAFIIGVSVQGLGNTAVANLVKSLRNFAIGTAMESQQTALALSVDEALVDEGILSPYAGSPEFLALADTFASDQLADTFFSGDQGVINQGALFSPGAAGSAGGSGGAGNQVIQPTPTPAPPAS